MRTKLLLLCGFSTVKHTTHGRVNNTICAYASAPAAVYYVYIIWENFIGYVCDDVRTSLRACVAKRVQIPHPILRQVGRGPVVSHVVLRHSRE